MFRSVRISFLFSFLLAATAFSQSSPILHDFSKTTAGENGITVMGPGFGSLPQAAISFGSIPTDNAFDGATDGKGMTIQANPGEGILFLTNLIQTDFCALIRCSIRSSAPHVSVYLATIDSGESNFVSTLTPNNGSFFSGRYNRLADIFLPPSSGFQGLVQIINTSKTDPLTAYVDNLEIISSSADKIEFALKDVVAGSIAPETTPTPNGSPSKVEKIVVSAKLNSSSKYEIYSLNPDGNGQTSLTSDVSGDVWSPRIAPDGAKIAYSATANGASQLFVMNSDGAAKRQVTTSSVSKSLCGWFDNDTLLYLEMGSGMAQLYTVDIDGSNRALLISNSADGDVGVGHGVLSPSGKTLAYQAQIGSWGPTTDIFMGEVTSPSSVSDHRKFYGDSYDSLLDLSLVWSRDGQTVYFLNDTEYNKVGTHYMQVVRKSLYSTEPVTEYDAVVREAGNYEPKLGVSMSPDGNYLLLIENDKLITLDVNNGNESSIWSTVAIDNADWGTLVSIPTSTLTISPTFTPTTTPTAIPTPTPSRQLSVMRQLSYVNEANWLFTATPLSDDTADDNNNEYSIKVKKEHHGMVLLPALRLIDYSRILPSVLISICYEVRK